MLGTLGEIPSSAVQVLEEMGVRGTELDKLIEDIHMIAVNKADECIQGEISRHEEISGLRPNKRRVVGQHMKRLNNEKTREKYITNKRKVRDQPDLGGVDVHTNHGERKSKSLFRLHNETNTRKE